MAHCVYEYSSPLGIIVMAADDGGLTGLWFEDQKYFAVNLPADSKRGMSPVLERTAEWLDCYFGGRDPGFMPPVHLTGTPFRMAVWEMLQRIPYGTTVTYGAIAREIARREGRPHIPAQAVGGAVGHNPVSILVPCHRVVGSDGSLTGYAGGTDRKLKLLRLEKADMTGLFVPEKRTVR